MRALAEFGAPLGGVVEADFAAPGVTCQIGVVSGRIDILTELTGITFADARPDRLRRPFGDIDVDFIGGTRSSATRRRPVAPTISATSRVSESLTRGGASLAPGRTARAPAGR
jgi:hypothetical protein